MIPTRPHGLVLAIVAACIGGISCATPSPTPSATGPRALQLAGIVTVTGDGITSLNAYIDGRHVGLIGGSDTPGSSVLPVTIGLGFPPESAGIGAGAHELSVVVARDQATSQGGNYATRGDSTVSVVDRDTGQTLSTRSLDVQQLATRTTGAFQWSFSVDASGRITSLRP